MSEFRKLANKLKKLFPDYKVSIRRVKTPDGTPGDCDKIKGKYLIRISNNLKEDEAMLWLIHEWAHCLSWDKKPDDDHSHYWGNAYAKCYKIYEKFIDEINGDSKEE